MLITQRRKLDSLFEQAALSLAEGYVSAGLVFNLLELKCFMISWHLVILVIIIIIINKVPHI